MKKIGKIGLSLTMLASTGMVYVNESAHAATQSQIKSAVDKAVAASKVLNSVCSIEKKGDIQVRPYREYNAAKQAHEAAKKLVNSASSKNKQLYLAQLDTVETEIDRGMKFIDAISAGLKIQDAKKKLEAQIAKNVLNQQTVEMYVELSRQIKNQKNDIWKVYGQTTREAIYQNYIRSAEILKQDTSYAVTVRLKLDLFKSINASNAEKLVAAKQILSFIELIPQPAYYKQLKAEWNSIQLDESIYDAEYRTLLAINEDLIKLKTLVKPGKSDPAVPQLYQSISDKLPLLPSTVIAAGLGGERDEVMAQLKVSILEIKQKLTAGALEAGIPPELVKALVLTENSFYQQFTTDGDVFKSPDNGYGLMQVTPLSDSDSRYDWNRIKYDLDYNIEIGLQILLDKWGYAASQRIPVVNDGAKNILENWYFAIMAYNGLSKANDPTLNDRPYQVKVYENVENYADVDLTLINKNQFKIRYNDSTGQMIFSDLLSYTTTKQMRSSQMYKVGDTVTLSEGGNLRNSPTTSSTDKKLFAAGTKVTIQSELIEDANIFNLYAWYKVKVVSTGEVGYMATSAFQ